MGSGNGSSKEKKLMIGLVVVSLLAIGLLVATIVLGVKAGKKDDDSTPTPTTTPSPTSSPTQPPTSTPAPNICITPECIHAASKLIISMNTSVNPCEDFFQYTCGGWIKENPIPATSSLWNQFDLLREQLSRKVGEILERGEITDEPTHSKQAKVYYKTCLGQVGSNAILKDLVQSVIPDTSVIDDTNLGEFLGTLRQLYDGNYLVALSVSLDEVISNDYTIYLDQPSFGLNRAFLVGNTTHQNYQAYLKLVEEAWVAVYGSVSNPGAVAAAIVAFEREIALITTPPEERRDRQSMYNNRTLEEVEANTTLADTNRWIKWQTYIPKAFEAVKLSHGVDLGDVPKLKVVLRDLNYFAALGQTLQNTDSAALGNYLKWRLIHSLAADTSQELRDIFFAFEKVVQGTQTPPLRSKTCADRANSFYGMAVSYHYVQEAFSEEAREKMQEMIVDLRESFNGILNETEWIATPATQEAAKRKAEQMKEFIAYPEWLSNKTALDHYYDKLSLSTPNDHFTNTVDIRKWRVGDSLKNFARNKDPNRWSSDPTVVNAFYSSTYNSITFPAGILQPPFYFQGNTIQALNYGAIGMVIGHEITHGFDDRGSQSDGDGNLREWWDPATLANYKERATCFVEQYSSYTVEELKDDEGKPIHLNGNNTQGENIADNGGVREAFLAYKAYVAKNGPEPKLPGIDLSPEQLFFIGFAQIWCGAYTPQSLLSQIRTGVHSPNRFRVRGVIDNSQEFAEAFNCPARPPSACKLW